MPNKASVNINESPPEGMLKQIIGIPELNSRTVPTRAPEHGLKQELFTDSTTQ